MPTVNTSCIQARFDEQLARLYNVVNYDPDSVLSYALSGVDLNDVGIIVAADVSSLPYLYYGSSLLPDGMVYFVQSLGIIVISSNNTWLTLSGTVVRTDTDYNRTVWSWGCNDFGQFGDNSVVSKSSPVSVVGGFTDWCQVSVGCDHSLGLRTNGTIWAWGNNGNGRLGDNTTVSKSSPVSVVGGFTDWCQISAGQRHSLGLRTNGTLWAWGYNYQGALGTNNTTSRSSPVSVVGGFTDWCQVAANATTNSACNVSMAVRQNGTAWAWGWNSCGQLGDNSTVSRSSPVSVVGGFTDWCQVSAGAQHSMGLRQTGQLYAWGYGSGGRLGDNSITNKSSPVAVVGGFTDWCQFNAVGLNSFAIRTNGTLWAWGEAGAGALGNNCATLAESKLSPVSVLGGFTDWCQVSGGYRFALAVRQNGSAWAWGWNCFGALGTNNTTSRSSPVSIVGIASNWFQVSGGRQFSAGVTFD